MRLSSPAGGPVDLFRFAQDTFRRLSNEFAAYGLLTNPHLELREGRGLMCYSDWHSGNLYVSIPDLTPTGGNRRPAWFSSWYGCRDDAQVIRFWQLLLPWGITHELAHHYRREHGLFGSSWWREELLANRLASAATKYRLTPEEESELRSLLEQSLDRLFRQGAAVDAAGYSAQNLLQALSAPSELEPDTARDFELMGRNFRIEPEELARAHMTARLSKARERSQSAQVRRTRRLVRRGEQVTE